MKTFKSISTVLGAMLIVSASAYASPGHDRGGYSPSGHHHNEGRYEHRSNGNWVVPLVIGGVLGYVLSEPRQDVRYVSTMQRPVMYTSQPMYREQWVYFSDCDCQRKVLVPVR